MHTATVRKREDPILLTQTDPIAYKDKLEETKDGEKGAPMPSMKLYPNQRFLTAPPFSNETKQVVDKSKDAIPELGEPIPEDLSVSEESLADQEAGEQWWAQEGENSEAVEHPEEEAKVVESEASTAIAQEQETVEEAPVAFDEQEGQEEEWWESEETATPGN